MKKRLTLVISVIIVCIAALFLTKTVQQKYIYAAETKEDIKNEKSINEESTKKDTAGEEKNKEQSVTTEVKKEEIKIQKNSDKSKEEIKNSEETKKPSKSKESKSSSSSKVSSSKETPKSEAPEKKPSNPPEKKEEINFIVVNTINNDTIVSASYDIEGKTVEEVTVSILNSKKIDFKLRAGYFSSIAGLKERSKGKASGWCYYVNGNKPGVGAGSYYLKKGDKVQWKFLEDGINN